MTDPFAPPHLDVEDYTGEVRIAETKQRIRQSFFRRAVLSGYRNRCCITGTTDTRLLVASHIVPWRDAPEIRLHPGNGLCLSAIHDRAFDQHLFSLTEDYRVVLSASLRHLNDAFIQQVFHSIDGLRIELPERFHPAPEFLLRHREKLLQ